MEATLEYTTEVDRTHVQTTNYDSWISRHVVEEASNLPLNRLMCEALPLTLWAPWPPRGLLGATKKKRT